VTRRFQKHAKAKGAKYTKTHGVRALVYTETHKSKSAALKREAEIKQWPRSKKLALICRFGLDPDRE
jgi:putative endonuclease